MTNNLTSQETRSCHARGEAISKNGRPIIRFEELPRDVLYTIVSKLPPKEFARTSILSSEWRCMWSACPRLTFDGVAVCKCDRAELHQHTEKFIHEVNAVLQKHHGMVVETLEVRIDFVDSLLVHHLNDWVAFAMSSRTKNLTLDLKPKKFWEYNDRYVFPFKLLDNGSISRLQHMQLSFVSLKPPSRFRGFPNLRKLHIQSLHVSNKDLEHVLSHCCNLVWLRIDRCDLNDELTVDGSLSHLLYLHVECCKLTKIKFHAVSLATFQYEGAFVPIDLSHSSKLQNAYIQLNEAVFQHVLTSLLVGLPNVQNLTLRIHWQHLEKQWLWDNPRKFSHLRHLQLFMFSHPKDVDKVLYSVSFLRATPFIEKLEVHFTGFHLWLADVGPRRQDFGHCKYNYLKNMCITGFKAARGQVEFLLHVVENAPALENVTINTNQQASKERWPYGGSGPPFEEAKRIAITSLSVALPQNVKFCVI
ncbi:F-box protein At5g03100-like [Phragmites australis]|uniref:F-box protein At5g03100-like n=1 Tax=Phragmites australis TaxID=29695 RepID=UPI002D786842|nr:F-box protein At5g03100-like [Phragmites australis]